MKKILFSIPSILLLVIIPLNFFIELEDYSVITFDNIFNFVLFLQIFAILVYILLVKKLWGFKETSKSTKWTWTLLMILVFQPITTLIYVWSIENELISNESRTSPNSK